MAVAGGGKGRRRFRTLSSEARRWLRVLGAAALLVLLMVAAWSRSLGSVGSAVTSASVRLSAGSLNSVAHAAAASAAWLEHQAHLEPGSSGDGGGGGGGSSEGGRDAKAGGRDAKAGGGDSKVDSGGDAKAGGGGAKFATWADELEASRGELPDGPEHEGLPCRASGYCSAGKLGPAYVGEVDSTEGYRKALAASCYKKECIHTTIGTRAHLLGLNLGECAGGWVGLGAGTRAAPRGRRPAAAGWPYPAMSRSPVLPLPRARARWPRAARRRARACRPCCAPRRALQPPAPGAWGWPTL